MPREEVLHLPVIQTIHLRGVDSLRVVYFLSLLFPSFASAARSLPPRESLRWETRDGGISESNAIISQFVVGGEHRGTCASQFGPIPGDDPHISPCNDTHCPSPL